jgi:hypothetical protein
MTGYSFTFLYLISSIGYGNNGLIMMYEKGAIYCIFVRANTERKHAEFVAT